MSGVRSLARNNNLLKYVCLQKCLGAFCLAAVCASPIVKARYNKFVCVESTNMQMFVV